MINNYLDWAKRERKYSVKMSVMYGRREREATDAWSKGFYTGLSMAYDYSGRHFKRLQKDIEARNDEGDCVGVVDGMTRELSKLLS